MKKNKSSEKIVKEQHIVIEEQKKQIEALSQQLVENSLMSIIAVNIKDFINIYKDNKKHEADLEKAGMEFALKMSKIALCIVVLVVCISAFLTYKRIIDGSTFTFLLGLIVGYVLTFIKQTINPASDDNRT